MRLSPAAPLLAFLLTLGACDGNPVGPGPGGFADATPPIVTVTDPAPSATVSGTVTVLCTATDENGITSYSLDVDGERVSTAVSCDFNWDSTTVADGQHLIKVTARDAAGNEGLQAVTVITDNFPDEVFVTQVCIDDVAYTDANGEPWDQGSHPWYPDYPDLWFEMRDTREFVFIGSSSVLQNFPPSSFPYCWSFSPGARVPNWNTQYRIILWDVDTFGNATMGFTNLFTFRQFAREGYPTWKALAGINGLRMRLELRWE